MLLCGCGRSDGDGNSDDKQSSSGSASNMIIESAGKYTISEKLENGSIIIDAGDDDKIELVLDGADITSESYAALYVKKAKKVTITLASGSENRLCSSGEFVQTDDNNVDGAIFSKDDIKIDGDGSLVIESKYGHGIVCKDEIKIKGGSIEIESASHAIEAKDGVTIDGGTLTLKAGKDGIHAENGDNAELGSVTVNGGSIVIDADGDGIDASSVAVISGGEFTIEAGDRSSVSKKTDKGGFFGFGGSSNSSSSDTKSMKGIKADASLTISGGTFNIDSADDAVHSNGDVTISGGSFIVLTGDDGFHSDTLLSITDGSITISESYEGLEGERVEISGGVIDVRADDDGINAAGGNDESGFDGFGRPDMFSSNENNYIKISGGVINIDADGDGVDSNGNLYVSGGEIYVNGPSDGGNGAIDYDGEAEITGGILVAAGASQMAQNFNRAEQGSILVSANGKETVSVLCDGETIISFTPTKSCNSIVISTPELVKGKTYTVKVGESESEITLDDYIYTSIEGGMGGFGGGGFGGGRPGNMPGNMQDNMPDNMPDGMPDGMQGDLPDDLPDDFAGNMPDNMPDGMPDNMPNGKPDGKPNDMQGGKDPQNRS